MIPGSDQDVSGAEHHFYSSLDGLMRKNQTGMACLTGVFGKVLHDT